jgi:hypothetical protein
MNHMTRLKELSSRANEFARGDRAIPAMRHILKGLGDAPLALQGAEGTAVPALRGNYQGVRKALNKFWETPHTQQEAVAAGKATRNWAAGEIRDYRHFRKSALKDSNSPEWMRTSLSASLRLKELSRKCEFGLFTTNKPKYNEGGQFEGMDRSLNPVGIAAGAAGLGASGLGAAAGHKAIMNRYGQDGVGAKQVYKAAAGDALSAAKGGISSGASALGKNIPRGGFGSKVRGLLASLAKLR